MTRTYSTKVGVTASAFATAAFRRESGCRLHSSFRGEILSNIIQICTKVMKGQQNENRSQQDGSYYSDFYFVAQIEEEREESGGRGGGSHRTKIYRASVKSAAHSVVFQQQHKGEVETQTKLIVVALGNGQLSVATREGRCFALSLQHLRRRPKLIPRLEIYSKYITLRKIISTRPTIRGALYIYCVCSGTIQTTSSSDEDEIGTIQYRIFSQIEGPARLRQIDEVDRTE